MYIMGFLLNIIKQSNGIGKDCFPNYICSEKSTKCTENQGCGKSKVRRLAYVYSAPHE